MWYKVQLQDSASFLSSVVVMNTGMERSQGMARVMSEEQLEVLRHQISAYAVISEQLAYMHSSVSTSPVAMPYLGMSSRQRWSPTAAQLEILERIFEHENGTPTKHKIKQIRAELSQHGQISETNVYNWFQNRRARSKRNPPPPSLPPQDFMSWSENESDYELHLPFPAWPPSFDS